VKSGGGGGGGALVGMVMALLVVVVIVGEKGWVVRVVDVVVDVDAAGMKGAGMGTCDPYVIVLLLSGEMQADKPHRAYGKSRFCSW
jgi:hypothetical protein